MYAEGSSWEGRSEKTAGGNSLMVTKRIAFPHALMTPAHRTQGMGERLNEELTWSRNISCVYIRATQGQPNKGVQSSQHAPCGWAGAATDLPIHHLTNPLTNPTGCLLPILCNIILPHALDHHLLPASSLPHLHPITHFASLISLSSSPLPQQPACRQFWKLYVAPRTELTCIKQ